MPKTTSKLAGLARASARRVQRAAQRPAATAGQIAIRAYDLYLARGCEKGHDLDDWLRAECELNDPTGAV